MTPTRARSALAALLAMVLIAGVVAMVRMNTDTHRTTVTAYFANSNGIFVGDQVRILGVPVGAIEKIEPAPGRAKITFWYDDQYKAPAAANAVIISPTLISARAIQLTPVYSGGPALANGAVIDLNRTAVPVEWDDLREQLQKLTQTLQPTQPGGVAPLGELINTAADNLRGQGASIRDTLIKLSQAFAALGDHSTDIFSTIKNLATLVSALQSSAGLLGDLNTNLATVTGLLSDNPNEIGQVITDLDDAVGRTKDFIADNRQSLTTTVDQLATATTTVTESLDDVKQLLHIAPTLLANYLNIYKPAQGALTGALALNNFADPIQFICGAVQAASRLGAEQSAKLCVQYLAPIIKNRQYNFPPVGLNPVVGTMARPNEITYSEDRLRPDYDSPAAPADPTPPPSDMPPAEEAPQPAPDPAPGPDTVPPPAISTNPAAGLPGLMVPPGGGS